MYKIATLNKISPKGLNNLNENYQIVDDIGQADGILVRSFKMHDLKFSSNLKAIARAGAGVNNIPLGRCAREGIVVFNAPGANANAVKELVFAGMLAEARHIVPGVNWVESLHGEGISEAVEKGKSDFAGTEVMGKTIGVIGLGAIGVMVANTASNLGMRVIGHDPYMSVNSAVHLSSKITLASTMDELLSTADYITVHVPAMDETRGMVSEEYFERMKDGVKILNFARGEIVDNAALERAFSSGKVAKYITDFPSEKTLHHDKIMNIPHLGASTEEAEENCAMMAVDELIDYLENGNITNAVNFPNCSMGLCTAPGRIAIIHENKSTAITYITNIMNELGVVIDRMTNASKEDIAYTLIDCNKSLTEEERESIEFDGLISVRVVR